MHSRQIEAHKRKLRLTREQREALIGLILGEAHLEAQKNGRTYMVRFEHSARHRAYVQHLYDLFRNWVLQPPRERVRQNPRGTSHTVFFSTVSHGAFRFYAHQFYRDSRKRVPKIIGRLLTARGLAYWYMDDGSIRSHQSQGVIFNTRDFDRTDVKVLIEVLRLKFGLDAWLGRQPDGWQIYVSGRSYERFVELVGPYVIPEMRYKIPPPRH